MKVVVEKEREGEATKGRAREKKSAHDSHVT